ncbi:MAG: ADOP family duplicated permease [Acidobacteriota bacterium]
MFWQDIRFGFRSLRRAPNFAITAAFTLAIGLGLNAALFTVFNTYVLQPIAARDPQSLYELSWTTSRQPRRSFSLEQYEMVRAQSRVFSDVSADQSFGARLEGKYVVGTLVSGNYFSMLGVNLAAGRAIGPADARSPGGDRVVVLAHGAWKRLFGGSPDAIGKNVQINGQAFTVIGVTHADFTGTGGNPPDFYAPLSMSGFFLPGELDTRGRDVQRLHIVGRLNPGITRERAMTTLTVLARNATAQLPERERAVQAVLDSKASRHTFPARALAALSPLLFVFFLLLLICCVNVSSMLLARAISRQKEIGVRLAIGASRSRLIRQLVSEGLLLGILGGLVGLAVSQLATTAIQALLLSMLPPSLASAINFMPLQIDARVATFIFAAATVSVFLFALAPALQGTKVDLVGALRGEFSRHLRTSTLRTALVSIQIAVCLTLVVLTGILLRNSSTYQQTDVGFDMRGISYPIVAGGWDKATSARLLQALHADPTLDSVSFVLNPPMGASFKLSVVPANGNAPVIAAYNLVSPAYFQMLRLPILQGRPLTAEESRNEAAVTVISRATARAFWPNQDPIGKVIRLVHDGNSAAPLKFDQAVVIGVTKDIISGVVYEGTDPTMLYFPSTLEARSSLTPLVRFQPGPGSQQIKLEKITAAALPDRAAGTMSLEDMFGLQVFPLRMASWTAGLLGAIALLLAASAMYGAMGNVVSQRTKEVGIRMALGATSQNIVTFFFRYCLRLAAIGLIAGTALSFGLSKVIGNLLVVLDTFDATAYAAGTAIVLVTGALAAYIPIRRIARANSIEAIRQE